MDRSSSNSSKSRSLGVDMGTGMHVRRLAASEGWLVNSSAASSTSSTNGSTDSSGTCSSRLRLHLMDASALLKNQLT
jgi:hypothetical protein